MHQIRVVAVLPVALALALAGCGGSSKTSSSTAGGLYGQPRTSSAATAAPAALITTKHGGKLGTILAYGPKKLTVYLFEADKGQSSSCTGACASVWPPVTGKPTVAGAAMSTDLGSITRPDGRTQVTYKGHPIYLYSRDKDDGDAYGEAIRSFGAEWYSLAPSGKKVDQS